jgi:hypothetical protein
VGGSHKAIINLSNAVKEMGLKIHMQKIKYREVSKTPSNSRMFKVVGQESERVRELKYLGSTLTEEKNIIIEIKQRILMAN